MLIRSATPNDAHALAEIYRPIVEHTTISFELEAPNEAEMRARIVQIAPPYPWLVAVDGGRVSGYAYASRHRARAAYASSVDVSVYVDDVARGKGIGRALYGALFTELAQTGAFHRAFAGIALPNDSSVAFHKSFDFELVGIYREVGFKFGRWIDVAWWQRSANRRRIS
ncbi:MAG: arsinothricin resistance N-acetyltransferase ArsN1 family B [Candidatus Cybelea sp.]